MAGGGASSGIIIIPSGAGIPISAGAAAASPIQRPKRIMQSLSTLIMRQRDTVDLDTRSLQPVQTLGGNRVPNSNHRRFAAFRQARRSAAPRGIFSSYLACSRALD